MKSRSEIKHGTGLPEFEFMTHTDAASWKYGDECPNGAFARLHTLTNARGALLVMSESYQPAKGRYQSRKVMLELRREDAERMVEYLTAFIEAAKKFEGGEAA